MAAPKLQLSKSGKAIQTVQTRGRKSSTNEEEKKKEVGES